MDSELESVCCAEISRVAALVPEGSKCITSHPGFEPICLNIHALQVAYYTLRQDRPSIVDAPDVHTYVRTHPSMLENASAIPGHGGSHFDGAQCIEHPCIYIPRWSKLPEPPTTTFRVKSQILMITYRIRTSNWM